MSETCYKVQLRLKEYDVYVKDSSTSFTTIRFKYDKCTLYKDVFLPDNMDYSDTYRILQMALKDRIYAYNKVKDFKRDQRKRIREAKEKQLLKAKGD